MGDPQPKLKLYYFNITGKGEPIRLLCAYAGLELEDYRFETRDIFNEMKANGKLPFGQVPLLEVHEGGDKVHYLVQSAAILKYLGKLSGLYPTNDPLLEAKIDAALAQETDAFTGATVATYGARFGISLDDDALKKSKEMIAKDVTPRHLKSLEDLLKTSSTGWICGTEKPSPADFAWYARLAFWMPEKPDYFPDPICKFEEYPAVKSFKEKFAGLDSIQKYYASKK